MNILHINSNYLTSKLHENLIDRVESDEIHNTIFMPIKEEIKDRFLYESKHEVHSPVTFNNRDKFIFTYKQNKIYKKLKQTLDVSKYDLIHAHTLFTDGNIAYRLNNEFGIPYVVTVRGYTDLDEYFKKRINLRDKGRVILEQASIVNFLSEYNKKELLNKYIHNPILKKNIVDKSTVIPNGIDDIYFEKEGKPKKINKQEPIKFIQVSKVMKIKNHLGSLHGIQKFSTCSGRDSKYDFVGEIFQQSYFDKIKKTDFGISTYHEPVNPELLIEYYRKSDIFIMPSFSETFGLVYPEAMSQGLPIIYTKGQGFDGQFEEGYVGYGVDPYNPEDIANKISLIIKNYDQISSNTLKAYKKFNWDNLALDYIQIYKNILNE